MYTTKRNKRIVKLGLYGIIVNLVLVFLKTIIGLTAFSIAVLLDAINNLTDVLSSVITIVGTKLSEKKPDKKHPYGHGRIEYFSAVIIAIIVLLAGFVSFKESVVKIINPATLKFSLPMLFIILLGVFVKFFFGMFLKEEGKKLNSSNLIASGIDAISDSLLSFTTFIGAILSYFFSINIEGYLGIIITIFIIRTALEILGETIDDMIGVRADNTLIKKIKKTINDYDEVKGVYDLYIHNYGPNKLIASTHIEISDKLRVRDIHLLTRRIEMEIFEKYGIILTTGIYASNEEDKHTDILNYLNSIIKKYKTIIGMHGFYVDDKYKYITFDLIFDFDEENEKKILHEIKKELQKKYPKYEYHIIIDTNISD